jgi:hypothetical protein
MDEEGRLIILANLFFFMIGEDCATTSQDLFRSERYNDILSASMGTPEHSDRLRGHSDFTTSSLVFNKNLNKRTSHSDYITKSKVVLNKFI